MNPVKKNGEEPRHLQESESFAVNVSHLSGGNRNCKQIHIHKEC